MSEFPEIKDKKGIYLITIKFFWRNEELVLTLWQNG